jgi:hypothetical protein
MNKLSNEDAAYIAGFIDGEGCISYEKYKTTVKLLNQRGVSNAVN